jgi:hypothetical protein
METVWQVQVIWQVDAGTWSGLAGLAQDAYSRTVSDFGGIVTSEGHAEFRRYRVAELCARLLRMRLGLIPSVTLAFPR